MASAAEEVIGQPLEDVAIFNQLKKSLSQQFSVSEKEISQACLNKSRNWLKRCDSQSDKTISIDLEGEAIQYIMRALVNLVEYDQSQPSEGYRFLLWLTDNQNRLGLDKALLADFCIKTAKLTNEQVLHLVAL